MVTDAYRLTYSYLRWLMALLPAVLFVVTVAMAIVQGELEGSISAYYGGPVRDVFVGVLIAVAVLLVVYQGATALEDYNFNGAGFYAAFVALVPTGLVDDLHALDRGLEIPPEGVGPAEYVWSLRISLSVVVALSVVLMVHELRSTRRLQRLLTGDRLSLTFVAVTLATLVGFQVLVMWQLWVPGVGEVTMDGLRSVPLLSEIPLLGNLRIHDLAAIFFICALAIGVWCHAWPRTAASGGETLASASLVGLRSYRAIFALMVAGPLVAWVGASLFAPGRMVILLEWWEIALFSVFWVLETRRQARASPQPD